MSRSLGEGLPRPAIRHRPEQFDQVSAEFGYRGVHGERSRMAISNGNGRPADRRPRRQATADVTHECGLGLPLGAADTLDSAQVLGDL